MTGPLILDAQGNFAAQFLQDREHADHCQSIDGAGDQRREPVRRVLAGRQLRRPRPRPRQRLHEVGAGAAGRPDRRRLRPDPALRKQYAARYKLDDAILFGDLGDMLDRVKPEAVASFTNTFDHAMVVEAAATRRIHVMMEKPLAVSIAARASAFERAAETRAASHVLVNYETTWYPSHGGDLVADQGTRAAATFARWWRWTATTGPRRSTCSRSSSTG